VRRECGLAHASCHRRGASPALPPPRPYAVRHRFGIAARRRLGGRPIAAAQPRGHRRTNPRRFCMPADSQLPVISCPACVSLAAANSALAARAGQRRPHRRRRRAESLRLTWPDQHPDRGSLDAALPHVPGKGDLVAGEYLERGGQQSAARDVDQVDAMFGRTTPSWGGLVDVPAVLM
jgi:hypothetical protein